MENLARNITTIARVHTEQIRSIFAISMATEVLISSVIEYATLNDPDGTVRMAGIARRKLLDIRSRIGNDQMEGAIFDEIRDKVAEHLPLGTGGADLSRV